jgi:hypothetical protein
MLCKKCNSERVASLLGHCVDRFNIQLDDKEYEGYVPHDLGIGGGDDIEMDYCLDCGQIQGEFPVNPECFEDEDEED